MRKRRWTTRIPLFLAVLVLASGCGESGVWKDDPKNWERAFEQEPPKNIKIVHSYYCRTPHFTHESEYFFEIAASDEIRKAYSEAAGAGVFRVTSDNSESHSAMGLALMNRPAWFAPKPAEDYEIYQGKPPQENYFLFIDKSGGDIFMTDRIGM
jgi:hypothetical protein